MIDTRNDYEVADRHLRRRDRSPRRPSFRDFPDLVPPGARGVCSAAAANSPRSRCSAPAASVARSRPPFSSRKASRRSIHLKGGILRYLETVPAGCQPVARRVLRVRSAGDASATDLRARLAMCCATPAAARSSPQDMASPLYENGVSCAGLPQRSEPKSNGPPIANATARRRSRPPAARRISAQATVDDGR